MHLHKTLIHVLTDIYNIQKCPKNSQSAKFAKRQSLGCHSNRVNRGMTVKRKRRTYQVYGFMTEQLFFKIRYIKFFFAPYTFLLHPINPYAKIGMHCNRNQSTIVVP